MQDLKLPTYPIFPNPLFLRGTRAWRYGRRLDEVHWVLPPGELWAGTALLCWSRAGRSLLRLPPGMDGCSLIQATEPAVALCDDVLAASPADPSSVKRSQKVFSASDSMAVWGWEPIHFHWEKFQATAWKIFSAYSITIGGLHLGAPEVLDWMILCCGAVLGLVGFLASSALYPLDASSTLPELWQHKISQTLLVVPWGA